ncbi:hypothetical protein EJB05_22971, partial [Eragrostis curvula]
MEGRGKRHGQKRTVNPFSSRGEASKRGRGKGKAPTDDRDPPTLYRNMFPRMHSPLASQEREMEAIDPTIPHVGTSQSRRRRRPSSSSFIARALKAIYHKCTKNAIEIREAREEARARWENFYRNIRNLCKANKVPYAAPPPYPDLPSDGDEDEDIFNFSKKPTRQVEESDEDTEVEGEGEAKEEESEEEEATVGSEDDERLEVARELSIRVVKHREVCITHSRATRYRDKGPSISFIYLTCSSCCERNWSVFEQVHTKKRNRQLHDRMRDLVFVKFNSKLRSKKQIKDKDPFEKEIDDVVGDDRQRVHHFAALSIEPDEQCPPAGAPHVGSRSQAVVQAKTKRHVHPRKKKLRSLLSLVREEHAPSSSDSEDGDCDILMHSSENSPSASDSHE